MRRFLPLALLVPLLAACGSTSTAAPPNAPPPSIARWIKLEHLPKRAYAGAKLFAVSGCTVCHTYAGSGTAHLSAPDLTSIGDRDLGVRFEVKHLQCPSCVNPGSPMPPFGSLGRKRLTQLAIFLEASKGEH
jgi:cbb3-type cytochrome oxidase cytochrome c subunit